MESDKKILQNAIQEYSMDLVNRKTEKSENKKKHQAHVSEL